MPKNTFLNLPEEKRQRILEVAIDEFSKNTFKNASISKIAENANISKGSVYQYFKDKKDLYKYVLEISSEKKVEYLMQCMHNMEDLNFIDIIRELYIKGIEFAKENPKLAAIGNNFIKENDMKFKEEILGMGMEKSNKFFEELIEKAKRKGEINLNIDTKVGAYMISSLNIAIMDYLLSYMKYEDVIEDTKSLLDNVDKMLYIIKNGFKA
ncbi:AcrR family transcriptional regulator [Clostridium tetanomorphum]|uniref:TetR/AcrR family transcriptional regulator n=1 Tax=Clostridium tetanomorphum TaxID=1553 RepID=A0A923E7R2_CLOTT|nr:TetR/AcrR family transcriptional regulator [Clostridium tetanomorphum]KAJ49281.1 TetR family transcriptional regulator [Clostridium tetanomorphum DSM 665]KAJ53929.1 TetR family transcriptional regulator [Clostridium tetanomorphum DSM 665]MBC2398087.1 TetR/AcrR family transcriptional regulator [Clostridium tetanomorphum]MBP1864654.1 AcrR family transcriptional regulator [Clostridium tetanomorphum]NRS84124.1 AcrR family transcriptional regulator [Clostridium tetanomorphum]